MCDFSNSYNYEEVCFQREQEEKMRKKEEEEMFNCMINTDSEDKMNRMNSYLRIHNGHLLKMTEKQKIQAFNIWCRVKGW